MEVAALPPRRSSIQIPAAAPRDSANTAAADVPRILIVEDEYLVAVELENGLAEAGLMVVGTATTAAEAERLATAEHPTLIVMDVRLPGRRDGVEAAIRIYRSTGIRCIFATACADAETQVRAREAEPLAWLSKPYQIDALVRAIADAAKDLQQ